MDEVKMTPVLIDGREVKVQGRLCRVAHADADDYKFLKDPEAAIAKLRNSGLGIDLFTFMQQLPETTPKYSFPMEWDNMAVLPVTTFENWWSKKLRFQAPHKTKHTQ